MSTDSDEAGRGTSPRKHTLRTKRPTLLDRLLCRLNRPRVVAGGGRYCRACGEVIGS